MPFVETCISPLFVPALRPALIGKAFAAGADCVILDLEDAVAEADKTAARSAVSGLTLTDIPAMVRINPISSEYFSEDVAAVRKAGATAVMLAKAETGGELRHLRTLMPGVEIVALIESAVGLENSPELLRAGASRLAFGSVDFALDIGAAHMREALLCTRARLVQVSRLEGAVGPVDGICTGFNDLPEVEAEARYAATLGFTGKLCIHPAQIGAVRTGFRPSRAEMTWARRIIATGETAQGDGAVNVDGTMVDRPVRLRAQRILALGEEVIGGEEPVEG
ncbi:HpcH/HpaI aldolase/citrate lyase family protein [Roseovarius amoyensis]|uniref:HpcH/HpaI aldolase/citrate lyase family protein n=1 Tax=Roseovarius amoyensis TaxID=2211448 RepID=UPI000DBE787E|nr:CoA ester lyase [Roseovarius amoyensis]